MHFDAAGQNTGVIAPLQDTDQAPFGMRIGNVEHGVGKELEVFDLESQRADWVLDMAVEAVLYQNQLRPEA